MVVVHAFNLDVGVTFADLPPDVTDTRKHDRNR
jgi:hypothetical protein